MKKFYVRFYEELNDFLIPAKKKIRFELKFSGSPSIKDIIESQGVPHTEIDMILVNGKSVGFTYKLNNGDDVAVYPEFESFDISELQKLRPNPLRRPKFVLDVHLGTLTRYMRMCGFDTIYQNDFSDEQIIDISVNEKRTILTRDRGVLKHNKVTRGYWVRNTNPVKQVEEIVNRFDLKKEIKEFTRCISCNSILEPVNKEDISDKVPPKVYRYYTEFHICMGCNKIYWRGSHYIKMNSILQKIKA